MTLNDMILEDSRILMNVIDRLENRSPIDAWTGAERDAITGALFGSDGNAREMEKAGRLERHLFGGAAPAVFERTGRPSREADRIRADLANLTPHGAGLHLLGTPPVGSRHSAVRRHEAQIEVSVTMIPVGRATHEHGEGNVTSRDTIEILGDLVERHHARTDRGIRWIVGLGDTALAMHGIREGSRDVHIHIEDVDDDVIDRIEQSYRPKFGDRFALRATPSDTLQGAIALRDIALSPIVGTILTTYGEVTVRAPSLETMYILTALQDRPDVVGILAAIAARTPYEAIRERVVRMLPWFADRSAVPEQVSKITSSIERDFGIPIPTSEDALQLPESIRQHLEGIRATLEARRSRRRDGIDDDPTIPDSWAEDTGRADNG